MATWVKSPFFVNQPVDTGDPPSLVSRAIDIMLANGDRPYHDHNFRGFVTTARELEKIIDEPLVNAQHREQNANPLDRVYYENNWRFARSLLCRKLVKDIESHESLEFYEDSNLRNFQSFLNAAERRVDLSFVSQGTSTSDGRFLVSRAGNRLLFHFGFDWLGIVRDDRSVFPGEFPSDQGIMRLVYGKRITDRSYIIRRTTSIAVVIRLDRTDSLSRSPLCPNQWASKSKLNHRRTVIMFNELYCSKDELRFTDWFSPDAEGPKLWDVFGPEVKVDSQKSALLFVQRFVAKIWTGVIKEMEKVINDCSKHIIYLEQREFYNLDVERLEKIATNTWRDMIMWHKLQKLVSAQLNSVKKTKAVIRKLAKEIDFFEVIAEDPLGEVIDNLTIFEKTFHEDFKSRGQSITDLVHNIINIRNAQAAQRNADAAQQESRDLGRISWITFIVFPLIAVSGVFGMNVDVFIGSGGPPSLKWYFIVGFVFTVVLLGLVYLLNRFSQKPFKSSRKIERKSKQPYV